MSISTLGARGAVLAVMLALVLPATASAGTFQSGCVLVTDNACSTTETRTYDDHYGYSPSGLHIATWLLNPSTGVTVAYGWGMGSSGGPYKFNLTESLLGWWGNYSGVNGVWVVGTFNY